MQSPSPAAAGPRRIDVHHHFSPPAWLEVVKGRPLLSAPNTTWTPAKSIEDMDRGGVASALVSVTNPGLWFGDAAAAARLARACNEYGARMVQDYPGRFGLFAALPLPDVDASLKEIAYALDGLKADGIGLFTSYGDTWLGNSVYRPILEELNRRKAVAFVHPTAGPCCRSLRYADVLPAVMEYGTDTTRAIIGLTFGGDAARFRDIRFIWSHAGGTMPFLAGRIARADRTLKDRAQRLPDGFLAEVKRFYYDVAGAANAGAVASLMKLVTFEQVLFGTDFPAAEPSAEVVSELAQLGFSEAELRAMGRENALRLLPRFGV